MRSLYQVLKASKFDPVSAPDMFTALWAKNISGGGSVPTEHEYTGVVPYSFNADGEPLLDWYIKGNTVQSGTPTPDSPIMSQGTGERTGNLFDEQYPGIKRDVPTYRPINVGSGTFTLSTSATRASSGANLFLLSGNVSSGANTTNNGVWNEHPHTVESVDGYVTIAYRYYDDTSSDPRYNTVMLNTGSTALPYEPYGIKIPISSANTTTPVYLGEVQTTRKVKKLVLTGQENWTLNNSGTANAYLSLSTGAAVMGSTEQLCTHYQYNTITSSNTNKGLYMTQSGVLRVREEEPTQSDKTTFESFLQTQYTNGTPVTVWYVLNSATTGIVNEPLMKIGDYADMLTATQAGVSIPTNNGSTTIDVDTTVKPSEVYIKYKG